MCDSARSSGEKIMRGCWARVIHGHSHQSRLGCKYRLYVTDAIGYLLGLLIGLLIDSGDGVAHVVELIDVEGDGMADMVFRCIQEMDIDNRMMDAPE
ncbi:Actin-related protein 2, variant 2 [Trifolium repens]|nr:Actin-related protein 2, variant 2 [Trifolium repens]